MCFNSGHIRTSKNLNNLRRVKPPRQAKQDLFIERAHLVLTSLLTSKAAAAAAAGQQQH